MNAILTALLPSLLSLLETPAFQSILKSILDDLIAKIAAGVPPVAATQQAGALLSSAATFHLTGNFVTDVGSLLANLHPAGSAAPNPVPHPATPVFNS